MNREQKIAVLLKYKNNKDGVIYLPQGLTLNSWWGINAKYESASNLIESIKEIEEELIENGK